MSEREKEIIVTNQIQRRAKWESTCAWGSGAYTETKERKKGRRLSLSFFLPSFCLPIYPIVYSYDCIDVDDTHQEWINDEDRLVGSMIWKQSVIHIHVFIQNRLTELILMIHGLYLT